MLFRSHQPEKTFSFTRLPNFLFEAPTFKPLSNEAKVLYAFILRRTELSFKNKRRVRKPQSEWVRVENTQEPIISEQVFRQVQEQIANRRRKCKDGTTQIFSGLVKCADCGWSLSYGENRQNSKPYGHYHCSKIGRAHV